MLSPGDWPVRFEAIRREDLNACLTAWGHKMGPVRRPTGGWSHGLFHGDALVAVAATDTLIRAQFAGLGREEAVELSCLCAARPDLCRVVLRLWRAFVFPELAAKRGYSWAVSYQDAQVHSGNLYRFDGWRRLSVSRSGIDTRPGAPVGARLSGVGTSRTRPPTTPRTMPRHIIARCEQPYIPRPLPLAANDTERQRGGSRSRLPFGPLC